MFRPPPKPEKSRLLGPAPTPAEPRAKLEVLTNPIDQPSCCDKIKENTMEGKAMMTRTEDKQIKFHMVTIEDLVPQQHFLRKLDRIVGFSFICTEVEADYLNLRQIWCEGSFAAQKARHNLRSLYRRELEAAEAHCLLSAMALNLKWMVKCLG